MRVLEYRLTELTWLTIDIIKFVGLLFLLTLFFAVNKKTPLLTTVNKVNNKKTQGHKMMIGKEDLYSFPVQVWRTLAVCAGGVLLYAKKAVEPK